MQQEQQTEANAATTEQQGEASAAATWAVLGGVIGVALRLVGRPGARLLARTASPWAWLLGACGLKRAAALFAP